jgi:uncharacterized protein YndB with AHSA1/START domain
MHPIKVKTLVKAPRDRVFSSLTDTTALNRWFTSNSTGDPALDSHIIWRWKDWGPDKISVEDSLTVLEFVRPSRFVFSWGPMGDGYQTTVTVEFAETPEGTVVQLNESGYRNNEIDQKVCLDCASGWGEALTLLKFYVEHGLTY